MEKIPTTHPDFGELEAYRRDEADAAVVEHIEGCAECAGNLEELESLVSMVRGESVRPAFPEAVDARIRSMAHETAARVRRQHRRAGLQRWAIAATVLLSLTTALLWRRVNPDEASVAKLDIVDALAAARQLAAAQSADGRYDVNHDGRVDGADVERIMRQAITLRDA